MDICSNEVRRRRRRFFRTISGVLSISISLHIHARSHIHIIKCFSPYDTCQNESPRKRHRERIENTRARNSGVWLKEWRKRHFVLKGNKLYFSKKQGDEPHGTIDLEKCVTVKSAEEKTSKRFSFEVATPESVYFMYASTEKEKDEWIGAIGRAIVKYSNVYTCDDFDDDY